MTKGTALVVGATGMIGTGIVDRLVVEGGWNVIALSRNAMRVQFPRTVTAVNGDLYDKDQLQEVLKDHSDITHLFFGAVYRGPGKIDSRAAVRDANLKMLRNIVEVLTSGGRSLKHAAVVTGAKYYGLVWSPEQAALKAPFQEDAPNARHPGDNYYFDLEDYILEKANSTGFTWSVVRPTQVVGFPYVDHTTEVMNIGTELALYATILKEKGLPLIYPGRECSWETLVNTVSTDELGRMFVWSATDPGAVNNAYNGIGIDEPFSWKSHWPIFADYFGMEWQGPGTRDPDFDIHKCLADRYEVWDRTVKKYGLKKDSLDRLMEFETGEPLMDVAIVFDLEHDWHQSGKKLRAKGFDFRETNTEAFYNTFDKMKRLNVIPNYGSSKL